MILEKKAQFLLRLLRSLVFLLALLLILGTLGFKRDSPTTKSVCFLDVMEVSVDGGLWHAQRLPHSFCDLAPGTKVELRTTITPDRYDGVYVEAKYARAKVYLDDELAFTLGKPENYPSFMRNPATEIHVVETYGKGEPMELRIEYSSPETGDPLFVDSPMVGTSKELILERTLRYGESWSLSLVQSIGGIALMMISLGILLIDRKGILFTCLGLFSVTTGLWFFGTNSFAITVFPVSSWLYQTAFIGFAVCMIPLLQFTRIAVDFSNPKPILYMEAFFIVTALGALLLQLCGLYPLHQSWNFFRRILPFALLILAALLLQERIKWHNRSAGRFFLPAIVLAASAVLELILHHYRLVASAFPLFQIGVMLFLLMMGIIAGTSVKDSIDLKKREQELLHEKKILDIQTEEQRESSLLLVENEQELSRQRHDLRHHLTAIQELSRDNEALQAYLATLMEQIPTAKARYCENSVVNAVISHYASRCQQKDIHLSVQLVVPTTGKQALDSNLCVIFSNLLENATEACERMKEGEKTISIRSRLQADLLSIAMENSFNGDFTKIGSRFRSVKRNDYGIGLSSIQAIAREAHGDASFLAKEKQFTSKVYLTLS